MGNDMRTLGIYAIRCLATGQVYVGSSLDVQGRMAQHQSALRRGAHRNRRLQAAWDAHGEGLFEFSVVEELATGAELGSAEAAWMGKLHALAADGGFNDISAARRSARAPLPRAEVAFRIMLALADGERHGYSIMREVSASTGGKLRLGPGTLYRSIKQLLKAEIIEESEERPDPALDDERRRYYRLTPFGRHVAAAEAARLERLVESARARRLLPEAGAAPVGGGA